MRRQKFAHAAIGQGNSLGYKCLFIDSIHIISIICGSAIDFKDLSLVHLESDSVVWIFWCAF